MELLLIGKLIKPYGLKGLIKADFYIDDFIELNNFNRFYIKDKKSPAGYKEFEIFNIKDGSNGIFVEITGCNDRTQADAYRGLELFVDEMELPVLKKGSFYIKDLLDIDVYYNGMFFGKISNVFETANKAMMIIKKSDGKEIVVPFENKYMDKVEVEDKKITVKNIEDLL